MSQAPLNRTTGRLKIEGGVSIVDSSGNPVTISQDDDGHYSLSVNTIQDVHLDPNNSSTINLASGATFTGTNQTTLGVAAVQIMLKATVASGTCTCTVLVEQSSDETNYDISDSFAYFSNRDFGITVQAIGSSYRVKVTNTSAAITTAFRLSSTLCPIIEALPRSLDAIGHLRVSDYPYQLLLARSLVPNNIAVTKFGRNPDVDVGTEDIWGGGGTWVPPT